MVAKLGLINLQMLPQQSPLMALLLMVEPEGTHQNLLLLED
jgi:hypothetical protein